MVSKLDRYELLDVRMSIQVYVYMSIYESHSRKGIPSAHMHWASISDLATLGMWADPGSYAWYVGGPRYVPSIVLLVQCLMYSSALDCTIQSVISNSTVIQNTENTEYIQ